MPTDIRYGPKEGFLEYAMIFDQNFTQIDLIDTFTTFYWIDRYNKAGDFELVMPVIEKHLPALRINNYLGVRESDRLMIIEDVTLKTDPEQGDNLVISGRSLESLLTRRIVWSKFTSSGSVQSIIRSIVNQNAASPSDPKRKIPGLVFEDSSDSAGTSATESDVELFGDNLYESVEGYCSSHNLGWGILANYHGEFRMKLYSGVDRSWAQTKVVPVVFSHGYENLLDSNYIQTEVNYVSNALVRGDEDDIHMEVMRKNERTGLARREMFINTNLEPETQEIEIPVTDDGGYTHTDTETRKIYDMAYYNRMFAMAKVEMAQHKVTEAFGCEVDIYHQFFFGQDYFIGDIVQVENRYGFKGRCRITEVLRSRDANGPKLVPSFVMVDEEGNEVESN